MSIRSWLSVHKLTVVFVVALAISFAACGGGATQPADLAMPVADLTLPLPGFGEPCAMEDRCADGLLCLAGPNGGNFCTKTCPAGSSGACPDTPAGTKAYCVVTDATPQGDKGCAFLCAGGGRTYPCPGQLRCEDAEDPPGSGQRLCLPQ